MQTNDLDHAWFTKDSPRVDERRVTEWDMHGLLSMVPRLMNAGNDMGHA